MSTTLLEWRAEKNRKENPFGWLFFFLSHILREIIAHQVDREWALTS